MNVSVIQEFEQHLPAMLNSWSHKLREGYSVHQCFNLISNEAPQPIAGEIRYLMEEIQAGVSWETASKRLLERVPSDDLKLVITAANAQRERGGNLADVLDWMNLIIQKRRSL
jgi:tight adherence protein B